jgi:cyanophycinase
MLVTNEVAKNSKAPSGPGLRNCIEMLSRGCSDFLHCHTQTERPLQRSLRLGRASPALLFVLFVGCGVASTAYEGCCGTQDTCPLPGAGVRMGGFSGSGEDALSTPVRRLILMGGGAEDDPASRSFVESAGGGDIVILRASGSLTSYPSYFSSSLSPDPAPASVVTLLTDIPQKGADAAVLCRLGRAEAVWLAGGRQSVYLGLWPSELHEALADVSERGGAVGGTSAGAVSLGEAAFDAKLGTVTSETALENPLSALVSVSYPTFAQPELSGVLVDSHFRQRSREGRLLAFLARFISERDYSSVLGIGLDERVAVILENDSLEVSTQGQDGAWFYELRGPVSLTPGTPLNLSGLRRIKLGAGSHVPWPLNFDSLDAEQMHVDDGVVKLGAPG